MMAYYVLTFVVLVSILMPTNQQNMKKDRSASFLPSKIETSELDLETPKEESVYQPLTQKNVKELLAQAILRPKLLPKLTYSKQKTNSKSSFPAPNQGMKTFQLPKLHVNPQSGSRITHQGKLFSMPGFSLSSKPAIPKKMSLSLPVMSSMGSFPLGAKQTQPMWLMSIKDLKSESCATDVYNRTINSKGCRSIQIESKYCAGRCNSFFVPSPKADFQSCSSCLPSDYHTMTVVLICPERKRGYKIKKIKMIRSCKCQSVMDCSPLRG